MKLKITLFVLLLLALVVYLFQPPSVSNSYTDRTEQTTTINKKQNNTPMFNTGNGTREQFIPPETQIIEEETNTLQAPPMTNAIPRESYSIFAQQINRDQPWESDLSIDKKILVKQSINEHRQRLLLDIQSKFGSKIPKDDKAKQRLLNIIRGSQQVMLEEAKRALSMEEYDVFKSSQAVLNH